MKPGIYRNLPFGEYLDLDALNNSTLTAKTPAHSQVKKLPTPIMRKGADWDKYLLEPHLFDPDTVKPKDHDDFIEMEKSLTSGKYEVARKLIAQGEKQVSIVWKHKEFGCLCKCRPDVFIPDLGVIVDVKSSTNAEPESWFRTGLNAGLKSYFQPFFYMLGANSLPGVTIKDFLWIVFSTVPPWGISVIRAPKDWIYLAGEEIKQLIPKHLGYKAKGHFPCYPDKIVNLPGTEEYRWYLKSLNI